MRIFFFLLFFTFYIQAFSQKKLALIVAVGKYMPTSGIAPIASVNDIKYLRATLKNAGFPEKNIDTLVNEKATKATILNALDQLAAKAQKGDIVFLHFSMHGQQIRDQKDGMGRDEEDGYDEALLPYDVKKPQYYTGVYTGENHLRDDDLAPKLINIRNKLGADGSLLVLIDACHSGTATRAAEFTSSRGEPVPFKDPENPLESNISIPLKDNFFDKISDEASNMVVISGSGPHQQNFQTEVTVRGKKEQVGSLTYAFYKSMETLEKDSDYELLFQKIKAAMQSQHPSQIPMLEGNTSQMVFSGQYKPYQSKMFATLFENHASKETVFKLDKGALDGIAEGTVIHLFELGTNKKIGEGTIGQAEHFESFGTTTVPLIKGISYEGRPESLQFGAFSTTLKLKGPEKNKDALGLAKQIQDYLEPYKYISIGDEADLMLDISQEGNGWSMQLIDISDSVRWSAVLKDGSTFSEEQGKDLHSTIKNSIRVKYLRSLPDGGALGASVEAEIVPEIAQAGKDFSFDTGEKFFLKIKNNSQEKLFYTVLDITPDNQVTVLYPTKMREPADYLVDKKSEISRTLSVSKNTPTGREFLKIIFSKEPLDIRSIFENKKRRSEMTSFQMVLDDLFTDNNTGTRAISGVRADEVGVKTVSFIVK